MDESAKKSSGEHESQGPEAAKAPANEAVATPGDKPKQDAATAKASDSTLPVVWSPKLDAGEETGEEPPPHDADEAMSPSEEAVEENTSAAAAAPSSRFALLAASVAVAAALGSFVGALSASGLAHLWHAPARPAMAAAIVPSATTKAAGLAELAAVKSSLDGANRSTNAQFAKLADRLDHVERAQTEPAAKIAHIADAIDRLEKRVAALPPAPETTGSITASAAPAKAANEPKLPEKILQDWVVQGAQGGRALVESRYGGVFDVAAGSVLPGLGRVEAVKRQDGEWVVVTSRGLITSGR